MAANIVLPKVASILSGTYTMGADDYTYWHRVAAPVRWPVVVVPQDAYVKKHSGAVLTMTFGDFCRRAVDLIGVWKKYLLAGAFTLEEFEQNINALRSWFLALQSIVGQAQHQFYTDESLQDKREWRNVVLAYNNAQDALGQAAQALADRLRKQAQDDLSVETQEILSAQTFVKARDYYIKINGILKWMVNTVDESNILNIWEANKAQIADEEALYNKWERLLIGDHLLKIQEYRAIYYRWHDSAWARVEAVREAKLAALRQEAIDKGEDPSDITYADVAISTIMTTGLWSWDEAEQLKMTTAQIQLAAKTIDAFTARLEDAMTKGSLKEIARLRDQVVKDATIYMQGVASGVRKQPLYVLAVSRYNGTLNKVADKLGEERGIPWGALALAAAGVGGYILLS